MGASGDEFPLLSALGLYAADIRGDGNCLFNALSDQLYGNQNEHANIRSRVIDYMREHADYYKQFIDVHPGGGTRRNPKRKNAGAYSVPTNYSPPSESDIDRVFNSHLQAMAKGGTYGDNMEITAFSSAFNVDVKIYQRDFAYMVTGGGDVGRDVLHIAYHVWEHYSSIRNLDGPHTDLPEVSPKALSVEEEQQQKRKLAETSHVLPWQVDTLAKSLPFLVDKPTIKRALEAAKGDVDRAWEDLNSSEGYGSASSQQESSSVEREQDSDDDVHSGSNKRQDRRMSRASKSSKAKSSQKYGLSQLASHDECPPDFTTGWDSETSSVPDSSQKSISRTHPTTDASDSDAPSIKSERPILKPRLKLLPPKPPPTSASSELQQQQPRSSPKTVQRQHGPRVSARDQKDIKKQAQKAARKERVQAASGQLNRAAAGNVENAAQAGVALRAKGMTGTPPVDTLRTLYI